MMREISNLLLALCFLALSGCVPVSSTSQFYLPSTTATYPPKPKSVPIPILGNSPKERYQVIGRLAFRSDLGWKFMRESMLYNARANRADAVILKKAESKDFQRFTEVPPRTDWVQVPGPVVAVNNGNRGKNGNCRPTYVSYPSYIPVFRPGYTRQWVQTIISIDSEMIRMKPPQSGQ